MTNDNAMYRVRITPSEFGGYVVVVTEELTTAGMPYVQTRHVDTQDEGRTWAEEHVAWLRYKQLDIEFVL